MNDLLANMINNPSYIAISVYEYDTLWEVSYISTGYANTVTLMYDRYGSMTPFNPEKRHTYIHVGRATTAGVYQANPYATIQSFTGPSV